MGSSVNRITGVDFRKRVTCRLLWEAMFQLLEKKHFDSITIKNICAQAQVNRSTFYNHFDSKFDLLRYGIETVVPEEAGITKIDYDSPDAEGPHVALFKYVKAHQAFWKNLLVTHGMSDIVFSSMVTGTKEFLKSSESSTEQDGVFLEIEAQMYIGAVGNLTIWWLKHDCAISVPELSSYVDSLWNYKTKLG